jgi:tRNA(His) 5'-end guanylyltransferase
MHKIVQTFQRSSSNSTKTKKLSKHFQVDTFLMPSNYIVVHLDGENFKKLSETVPFHKPNDQNHINLMNECGRRVFRCYTSDLMYAYGFSDEFTFAFEKNTNLFNRSQRYGFLNQINKFKFNSIFLFN